MNTLSKDTIVSYTDTELVVVNKVRKSIKVAKYGIWDGEQVVLNDRDRTTVRNTAWLKVITPEEGIKIWLAPKK